MLKSHTCFYKLAALGFILIFLGCSVSEIIDKKSNASNIISRNDAKKIAVEELSKLKLEQEIRKKNPIIYDANEINYANTKIDTFLYIADVFSGEGKSKYDNSWFVIFKPRATSFNSGFLVVINKIDGSIEYSYLGNIVTDLFSLIIKKDLNSYEVYVKAVIEYHKENHIWPNNKNEFKVYVKEVSEGPRQESLKQDWAELMLSSVNEREIILSSKKALWFYKIVFENNNYKIFLFNKNMDSGEMSESLQNIIYGILPEVKTSNQKSN